jgi:two-component system OmpR family response regulator
MTTRASLSRILYIEDDADIRTVAQIALEAVGGFTLAMCDSGRTALDAVAAGFVPDLILLDVMMPGMDGPRTLTELRKRDATAAAPVIFMTAKVQASEIAYYKSLGAMGVVAKPFDPMLLAQQVRRLWEQEHALAQSLQALNSAYAEKLPERLQEIAEALQQCVERPDDASRLDMLLLKLHSLSGTAGTFGFAELGLRATEMEVLLKNFQKDGASDFASLAAGTEDMLRWAASLGSPAK